MIIPKRRCKVLLPPPCRRGGQSLIELLIAVVIGTIMVLGTIAIISPSIRSNAASSRLQIAVGLGKGLFDSVRVLAESDWMTIANLNTSGTLYYIVASSSPFTVATGTESVQIVSTTYTRYFYVSDVGRDTNGFIVSP